MTPPPASPRRSAGADLPLADVAWSPRSQAAPFEIVDRGDLFERMTDKVWQRPEQLQFDLIIEHTGGTGFHMVDFETLELIPNSILHIRPGQIHQWQADAKYSANLYLIREFRSRPLALWSARPATRLVDEHQQRRLAAIRQQYDDWANQASGADPASVPDSPKIRNLALGGLRDLVQATLAIPSEEIDQQHPTSEPYFAFRTDLEQHLDHRQTVKKRAIRVGYSTRTLDRACQDATGKTAKRLADERIALEARRLLALPSSRASAVARTLGFDEPTNFTKFVKRMTGRPPSDWQNMRPIMS